MKLMIIKICPECHKRKFIKDDIHDEIYCKNCGLVIQAPYTYGVYYPGFPTIEIERIDDGDT